MNASRRFQGRLFLVIAIAVAALVVGAAAAIGQSSDASPGTVTGSGSTGSAGVTGVAVTGTAVATPGVVSSGIAAPWCCGASGEVPGLTAVGQASADGQDPAARNAAIAKAVKDATDQANAAADAAGITLGPIVDLQISAIPFAYPMMGTAGGSSAGSPGTGAEPVPYQSYVSVTITWSLG